MLVLQVAQDLAQTEDAHAERHEVQPVDHFRHVEGEALGSGFHIAADKPEQQSELAALGWYPVRDDVLETGFVDDFPLMVPGMERMNEGFAAPTTLYTQLTNTVQSPWLAMFRGAVFGDDDLDEVRALLTASGSRRFVEQLAEEHLATARSGAAELGISLDLLEITTVRPSEVVDGREVAA